MIFVFGSNLAGRHGKGAAAYAVDYHGAVMGCGKGRQGNAYAIPTKDVNLRILPFRSVEMHVELFIDYAFRNFDLVFQVTAVGTGYALFTNAAMASLFLRAPNNCQFDERWRKYLGNDRLYWGSYSRRVEREDR